jgi:RNA polymerase sigma-70 factor (ECF subfamily)
VTDAAPDEPTDAQLVAAMAAGDQRAAARLYDRHASLVFAIALRVTGERSDAEDVVVECFAQAWEQAGRYDASRAAATSWLANIARSRALDLVRARGRRDARVAADSTLVEATPVIAEGDDALARIEGVERDARVAAALATLPAPQRAAIELAFWDGLSHSEIAARTATPLGTIKTRIRTGMLALRARLAPAMQQEEGA